MSIPIGSTFERFINWLTSTFGGVFDAISAVLDWAISTLENALLLDATKIYPSVFIALLAGIITLFLARRKLPWKSSGIIAGAVVLGLAVIEIWRVQAIERPIEPEEARAMAQRVEDYRADLDAFAPRNYEKALKALGQATNALEDREGPQVVDARDMVEDARNEIEDLRPGRYDEVADELEDAMEGLSEAGMGGSTYKQMRKAYEFYLALSAMEEGARLARNYERVDEPEPLVEALNERTYDRNMEIFDLGLKHFPAEGMSEASLEKLQRIRDDLSRLNPRRLQWYPWVVLTLALSALAYLAAGTGLTVFTLLGLPLIVSMGFWQSTMETLALVLSATLFALLIGVPVGVLAAQSKVVDRIVRPILDFMQTMPAFVYLIPAVLFFGLGKVPGAMATLIFSMPPAVRLTSLGIRQVPLEVVEAAQAFGATTWQMLVKAQLPIALPTILAGVNQTIMLALSMVVIAGMIGAGGLGEDVLSGITQLKIGLGFESGISVVILAIFLDRITQALGGQKKS